MNIGIDARSLVEKKVGFGYFLENMLDALLSIDHENTYYLFSDRKVIYDSSRFHNVVIIEYKDGLFFRKSFYYYFRLAAHIKKLNINLDVFWGTMHILPKGLEHSINTILTVHDFTHIKFPESTTKFNLMVSKLFFGPSVNKADEVVCISHNTEKELKEYYPAESERKNILCIYEGGYKDNFLPSIEEDYLKPEIKELKNQKYILFVGTIEPRKNIKILIEAAPKLKGTLTVIICGKIGWEKEEIVEQLYSTVNLVYFDYVSQEEKTFLMKNAFCQIQPSLYEGFGLPVVESMQSGTVVVVADNSSLSEIVELEELKFRTNDAEDLCRIINTLYYNEKKYRICKEYCMLRGVSFSWSKAAHKYLKLFSKD